MTQILIADDHDLVRDTIAAYLGGTEGFTVHTAANLNDAMEVMAGDTSIDLVILDYEMPGMNGLDGLTKLRDRYPSAKAALMSGVANDDTAARAFQRGALGYFPKSLSVKTMVSGIRQVLAGEYYAPFDMSANGNLQKRELEWGLTPREFEVLEKVSMGMPNKDIAEALDLKEVTVKLHVKNLMAKMGAGNRTQAALMAREKRLF